MKDVYTGKADENRIGAIIQQLELRQNKEFSVRMGKAGENIPLMSGVQSIRH